MEQNYFNQIRNAGNVIFQVSAQDLKEVVKSFYEEERERREEAISASKERYTISRREASKLLGVTLATLWRWANLGYLTPVKIGSKVMYRASDIEGMLANKSRYSGEGGAL